jgi:hypothetical protein
LWKFAGDMWAAAVFDLYWWEIEHGLISGESTGSLIIWCLVQRERARQELDGLIIATHGLGTFSSWFLHFSSARAQFFFFVCDWILLWWKRWNPAGLFFSSFFPSFMF